jgi:Na+/melibiose symporter-like transporter
MAQNLAVVNEVSAEPEARAVSPGAALRQRAPTLLAYGSLALPLCIASIPIVNYLPAYYAQELHLSVGLVGAVFLAARLWDGLSDLLIGWLSDRTTSRWGRRKPWAILGAPVLMIATWFLCVPKGNAGLAWLFIWAAIFYTSWTAMYIPYISWGTELATDYVERSRVSGYREFFTMLGNLVFAAGPLVVLTETAPLDQVLKLIATTVLCTVPVAALLAGVCVRDPVPRESYRRTHLLQDLKALIHDRVLVRIQAARLLYWLEEGVNNSLTVFAMQVGLNLPDKMYWLIFIIWAATVCTLPLTLRLSRRMEKHRMLVLSLTMYALVWAGATLMPSGNFPLAVLLYILMGVANSAQLILPNSILADVIDHGEVTSGDRRAGPYVAIDNLMQKLGLALGVGLSFGLLALLGYNPAAAHHSLADIHNIRLLGFGLPCLLLVPVIILYGGHPITRKVHRRLRMQIEAQRYGGTTQFERAAAKL